MTIIQLSGSHEFVLTQHKTRLFKDTWGRPPLVCGALRFRCSDILQAALEKEAAEKKKKPPAVPRMAGGQKWWDPTLTEWPPNDFRIFVGDLGNEVCHLKHSINFSLSLLKLALTLLKKPLNQCPQESCDVQDWRLAS